MMSDYRSLKVVSEISTRYFSCPLCNIYLLTIEFNHKLVLKMRFNSVAFHNCFHNLIIKRFFFQLHHLKRFTLKTIEKKNISGVLRLLSVYE